MTECQTVISRAALYPAKRMNDGLQNRLPSHVFQARQYIAELGTQLEERGLSFRSPPEEPTSCCQLLRAWLHETTVGASLASRGEP